MNSVNSNTIKTILLQAIKTSNRSIWNLKQHLLRVHSFKQFEISKNERLIEKKANIKLSRSLINE